MTAPWATAEVDAELDWGDLDQQIIRRLERASQTAQRAVNRNFDKLAADSEKKFEKIERGFDKQLKSMERRSQIGNRTISREFNRIDGNAKRAFDKIATSYDRQMQRMERRTASGVAAINRTLGRIEKNTQANVDIRMTGADVKDLRSAASALRRLQKDAGRIAAVIDIKINSIAEVRELDAALKRLPRRRKVTVDVDVDKKGGGTRSLAKVGSMFASLGKTFLSGIGAFAKWTSIAGAATLAAGALVPVIGALGAGIGALGMAAGVVAVGGLFALGAAAGALKTAFSGVGDAAKYMFDPDKAEQFEKALADLSPSAQATMRSVQKLGKAYADIVKTPVQETFFSGLAPKIAGLQRLLPAVRDSLVDVAQGFNDGANGALRMINTSAGMRMMKSLLADSGRMGSNFGAAITALIPGFAALGAAATNVLSPMTDGIGGLARKWSETMLKMQQDGTLQNKMRGILDVAKQIGAVFGKLGSIIGGVFSAAAAAGDGNALASITGTLDKVSEWVHSFDGQNALTTFFRSAREAVAAVVPVFLQIAQVIGSTVAPIIADIAKTIGPALVPAVKALGEGIKNAAPQIHALAEGFAKLIEWVTPLLPKLVPMLPTILGLALGFKGLSGGVGIASTVLTAFGKPLSKSEILVKIATKAFGLLRPVLMAVAGGIRAVGMAILTTPVGWIIAAVVAAGVALWAFFTKTEVGRQIWDRVWNGIKTVVSAVVGWFTGTAWPWIRQAYDWIAEKVTWLWQTIVVPAWEGIKNAIQTAWDFMQPIFEKIREFVTGALADAFNKIKEVFQQVWEKLQPVFESVRSFIEDHKDTIIMFLKALGLAMAFLIGLPLMTLVATITVVALVIAALAKAFSWAWTNIIQPVIRGLAAGISWLWTNVVQPVLQWIGDAWNWLWTNVIQPVSEWIKEKWQQLADKAVELWEWIQRAVDWIKTKWDELWEKVGPIIDWIKERWDNLRTAFEIGKNAIGTVLENIKTFFTNLWNHVKTIIDNIKTGIGSIGENLSRLPGVSLLPGFAVGGRLVHALASGGTTGTVGGIQAKPQASTPIKPGGFIVNAASTRKYRDLLERLAPHGRVISGPGTGTSDSIAGKDNGRTVAMVSKNEYYAPPEDAAGIMPLLMALNAGKAASKFMAVGGQLLAAFAPGGMLPADLRARAQQAVQSGYVWGGWGQGWNTDCSGLTSSLANMATGRATGPGVGERTATGGMGAFLAARGFREGKGPAGSLQIGWSDTHSAATLPTGENIEHTGPEGSPASFGANAKGADSLPNVMNLPMGGDTSSGAMGDLSTSGTTSGGGLTSTPGGGFSGGTTSYGNAGGSSKFNSSVDAKRGGLTPVWVENWPSTFGGSGGGLSTSTTSPSGLSSGTTTGGGLSTSPAGNAPSAGEETIELVQQPDGTWKATNPAWDHLIQRESGGKADIVQGIQDANSGGNEASGLFQIARGTWAGAGGTQYAPTAGEATPQQQALIAAKIFKRDGGSPWGAGLAGRESEDELRAGITTAQAVPVTPQGTVPVTPQGGDLTTTPPVGDLSTQMPDTTTTPGTTQQTAKSSTMPYGKARADQWLSEQNLGASAQDIGVSALKEIGGEFGDLIGVTPFVERGIDEIVAYLKQIAEKDPHAEFKWADIVNINGADPAQTKQQTTEGMTAVMDTYRQG